MMRFEPLYHELSDGICVADSDGLILYMNPAAKRLLDIPEGSPEPLNSCRLLCGKLFASGPAPCSVDCALRERGSAQKAVSFVGRHGPRTSFDWKGFQVNRRERWAQLRVRCLKGSAPDERHLIVIEDAAVELELAKRKEDWRRMVAHDLRSPITSVLAALLLLKEKPAGEGLDAKEANLLDVSVRSCRRLTELLDLFLDVAKLDEGVMPVSKKAVALLPLVREAVAEQSALAASKRVSVDVAMDAELAVLADEELLSRAVRNLLNNGIKFTHKDGRITIRAERAEAGAITLSVEDTGSGIAPADLPSLFDRFYQASARREGRIQGNGLGLTFCREALKAMGGEIGVRSEVGKGSEFVVRLPAAVPDGRR